MLEAKLYRKSKHKTWRVLFLLLLLLLLFL